MKVLAPSAKLMVPAAPGPTMLPAIAPPLMLRMSPWLESWIAPVMVPALWLMVIAFCAVSTSIAMPAVPVMLPELEIAPEKVATALPRKMPVCA